MKKFIVPILLFFLFGSAHAQNSTDELNRVLSDMCDKKVVLLGEDVHHGGGETLRVKTELVERLVNKCGFSNIFFESQVYDFVDLKHKIANHTVSRQDVANAIGGLWSTTADSETLISFLFAQAVAGKVRLYGLDPQVAGATQVYSQRFLSRDLTRYLQDSNATQCESELQRLLNWRFDDSHPYDETTRQRIKICATEILEAIKKAGLGSSDDALMARNLQTFADFEYTPVATDNFFNARDKAMFENFAWQVAETRRQSKSIIWCATVHAAKELKQTYSARHSLGEYIGKTYGENSATIGFSAIRGSYGRRNQRAVMLGDPVPGSLEASVLSTIGNNEMRFLNHATLKKAGVAKARAINYDSYSEAHWSKVIDGLIILREERPLVYRGGG